MIQSVGSSRLQIVQAQQGATALSSALNLGQTLHLVGDAWVDSEACIRKELSNAIGFGGRQTDWAYVGGKGHDLGKLQQANVVGHRLIMVVWVYDDLVDLLQSGKWIAPLLGVAVALRVHIRWIPVAQ